MNTFRQLASKAWTRRRVSTLCEENRCIGQRVERTGSGNSHRIRQNSAQSFHKHSCEEGRVHTVHQCVVQNVAAKHDNCTNGSRGSDKKKHCTEEFPQGAHESPPICTCVIDDIMDELQEYWRERCVGCSMDRLWTPTVGYAGDVFMM